MANRAAKARARATEARLPPWTPFERVTAVLPPEKRAQLVEDLMMVSAQRGAPMTREQAEGFISERGADEMHQNSRYTVLVEREAQVGPGWPPMIWLSVRRNDRQRPGPERWRDFQRIKSELVGPENEGCELYPAESRVADTADQFHIFVFRDPSQRFPFGFRDGLRVGPMAGGAAAQTPFDSPT
jgi:hypothetical protein